MNVLTKLIELNGGNETKAALESGLNRLKLETYYSKYMALLIDTSGKVSVWHKDTVVSFNGAILHNRYPSDHQFVGILMEHAEALGLPVINKINTKYAKASEKIGQMARFARNDIPVPVSIIMRKEAPQYNQELIATHMKFPVICKTDGMKGDQVYKINSMKELVNFANSLTSLQVFKVQEYIPNTFDLRLICIFGEYLGAIKRSAPTDSFKNNYSQGGAVEAYNASPEEIDLALRATAANDLDIAGVDIIHSERGPLILEVNQGPGVDGFQSVHTDRIVMAEFAKLLEKKYLK